MEDIHAVLREEFRDPEARKDYAEEFLNSFIALQIKTLRQQREWSQEDLAERAGMKQSRISAMEQVDYDSWSVRTLKRLAQAFDLALIVRFESFGEFLGEVTSVSRQELERPSFVDDPEFVVGGKPQASASDAVATIAPFRDKPLTPGLRVAAYG